MLLLQIITNPVIKRSFILAKLLHITNVKNAKDTLNNHHAHDDSRFSDEDEFLQLVENSALDMSTLDILDAEFDREPAFTPDSQKLTRDTTEEIDLNNSMPSLSPIIQPRRSTRKRKLSDSAEKGVVLRTKTRDTSEQTELECVLPNLTITKKGDGK